MVIAPSQSMLTSLEEHYGPLPAGRVIHNGLTKVSTPAVKEQFVLSAGRLWDEAKNIAALERVAPLLSWPIYVAGEDVHQGRGVTGSRGLRSLGRLSQTELGGWMARAAIYALPARYEPFGLSALEAAQSGCALVLGDIASLREVWGEAAVFVPPDDTEALAAALQTLIEDEGRRRSLAGLAREQARRYTPERMAGSYLKAYSELIMPANVMLLRSKRERETRERGETREIA
jgi:glycosyltransferase involved in cell wall biosynthesis